jgi:ribosome biogenesis protein ENP2
MRGLDAEIVKFCVLSPDYKKVAMALSDRNIELHAQYGKHYRTRVPKMPTDMIYNPYTCDLLVSSTSDELVRISLDQGQFLASISCG